MITRLEHLKKEAAEISAKIAQTEQIIDQVELVINEYRVLAQVKYLEFYMKCYVKSHGFN